MRTIRADVSTVCMGLSASMATVILAGGAKGKRYSLPHATIHMHPAGIGRIAGAAPDVDIHARELLREQQLTRELLAGDSGQSISVSPETSTATAL
jgi:ATP-dependent Clp protease protease subunit